MKFISELTKFLLAQKHPLHEWVVIVPSQRSVRYIQKALYEQAEKPVLSPKIITINRFFETVSPLRILDKTRLLFRLYNIHQQHSTVENKTFDEFYNWGKTLLSDFDEIDRYQIPSSQLFKNLQDIKEIENWSFNSENLTETQLKFIQFWKELGTYYHVFQQDLAQSNASYAGFAVRQVAENNSLIFKKYPNEKFLFAGFNAHSPAELSVIKQLLLLGKANVLFDGDTYYVENGLHEAGMFIRKNLEYLGIPQKQVAFKNELANKSLDVRVIACSQITGQVKATATILQNLSEQQIAETLVLLAEEDLLVPLLKNIPAKVGKANITLGLSLDNSILKTWVELIFKIQKGLQTRNAAYYKDIFELLYHPFVEEILTDFEKQELIKLELVFKKNNLIYTNPQQLTVPEKIKKIIHLIYTNWDNNWAAAIHYIRQINQQIYENLSEENEYEKALLETFDSGIIDLQNCIAEGIPAMSLATFKNLFTSHYASLAISYFGNPIDGLQIMGLLETRMLDFKRIICVGMNEKNMPPNNTIHSLIPMDLRIYFGLPTVREKQGIFAHHFYRLLHHVEELHLLYSSSGQDFNSSEMSRYIMQMELEWMALNPNIRINYQDYSIENTSVDVSKHLIPKNTFNKQLVKSYLEKGISASAMGDFYTCPLDFFYKYILKFNDDLQVDEDIESSTFGSLIHETLERMYAPFSNRTLTEKPKTLKPFTQNDIDAFKKHIDYQLNISFKDFFKTEETFQTGRNRLSFEMAKRLSHGFLKYEEKHLQEIQSVIYVEDLEQTLTAEIPNITLQGFDQPITLKLKGIIDRIDYHNGAYHIIDYKSGKVQYDKLKLKEITEEKILKKCKDTNSEGKKFMQFFFYLYLFYRNFNTYPKSITFVSFVNIHEVESFQDEAGSFEKLVALFPSVLQQIIDDIFDEGQTFQHIQKGLYSYCKFCE